MNLSPSVATNLSNDARKSLAILSLSKAGPIAHLADREGVSRKFIYEQKRKVVQALDQVFAPPITRSPTRRKALDVKI